MLNERQLAETLCFYYGYDSESDRILPVPIVQRCCCGKTDCKSARTTRRALKQSSVWHQSLVSCASAALRRRREVSC